ncbi:hypothetical protein VFPPC_16371 [Pochonia chlamydosporia 170]|uniref:Uncharacterized protein n=1 Tax=Pochonia chlamydosporia 170 TaxID=1380566 RepID=A0A179FB03_METCM|nr:hypothetical protein VFPPC_16371 [Pochonia chlamydosporia 170]OAQ62715.1 hypothetical protein VFPPC_16371 [Pochonia chlamydosporia 170]
MANIRRCRVKWTFDVLLMATSQKFDATDQRDKIFGLLGMAEETHDPALCPEALRPNYHLSLSQVYRNVAIYLIYSRRSFVSLTRWVVPQTCVGRFRRLGVRSDPLPSWVPNWTVSPPGVEYRRNFVWIDYSVTGDRPSLGFPSMYNASKGQKASLSRYDQGNVLCVRGLLLDEVLQSCAFSLPTAQRSRAASRKQMELLQHFWNMATDISTINTISLAKSFVTVTTADQSQLGQVEPEQMIRDGAAYIVSTIDGNGLVYQETAAEATNVSWLEYALRAVWCGFQARRPRSTRLWSDDLVNALKQLAQGGKADAYSILARRSSPKQSWNVDSQS